MPTPNNISIELPGGTTGALLAYDQLPDITQPEWTHPPIMVHRSDKENRHLLAVGVCHRSDPSETNIHYRTMIEKLELFKDLTRGEPAAVIVEGGMRTPAETAPASYRQGGEAALAAYYAQKYGFQQRCFEPSGQGRQQVLALDQGFTTQEFDTFLFGRFVPSYWMLGRPQSFRNFVDSRLTGSGGLAFDWGDKSIPTYQQLVDGYERAYAKPFTPDDPQTLHFLRQETHGYMLPPRSRPHQACIAANLVRDTELARGAYGTFVLDGLHTFIASHYAHIVTLGPLLRSFGVARP